MKRTFLALLAIAAMTAASASVASAQEVQNGPGGRYMDRDQGYGSRGDNNCRIIIAHRRGPNGSVTVRRRVCD